MPGLGFMAARQEVQRLVEELPDANVEILQAVQVHRQHVVALDPELRLLPDDQRGFQSAR